MKTGCWTFIVFAAGLFGTTVVFADPSPKVFTDADLLAMAGNPYPTGELPLGDGHYVTDAPRKGYIYLCRVPGGDGGGAQFAGPWIHQQTWTFLGKPTVSGMINWDQAQFSNTISGDQRLLQGNGLPISHSTGVFPVRSDDAAYQYDRNPNSISAQNLRDELPLTPEYTDPPYCMGMEVGTMLTGVPLFNGFDAELRDAPAHELQDHCNGHPQRSGQYHYHSLSACVQNTSVKTVLGFALDGFPITGPVVADGKYLATRNLDECHGITSEIMLDGKMTVTYHYVMTQDFPYSVSCFRARPVRIGPPQNEQGHGMQPGRPQPPQEALAACGGMAAGSTCGFVTPRGDVIAGICRVPPGMTVPACVPDRR